MDTTRVCESCRARNKQIASFCARCGLPLDRAADGSPHQGSPSQWRACDNAADLKYRLGSAWGGRPLLGTENMAITLLNLGRGLQDLIVEIRGLDAQRRQLFSVQQEILQLSAGQEASFELPSYEIADGTRDVALSLISATRV